MSTKSDIIDAFSARMLTLVPDKFAGIQADMESTFLDAMAEAILEGGGGGSGPSLSDATPEDLGTADPGVSPDASRADHVHKIPTIPDLGVDTFVAALFTAYDAALKVDLAAGDVPIAWVGLTSTPTTLAGYGITDAQPLDADLTAVAALSSAGLAVRTGSSTWTTRTLTGTAGRLSVTNGDGVSGAPTVDLATSGVSAGSYGSSTAIPVVTVDAYGRVTAVSTASPSTGATIWVHPDASITAATGYELVGRYLQTKVQRVTDVARADVKGTAYGWTWANSSNLASANENTTTANAVHGVVTSTSSNHDSGTFTAPCRYQSFTWDGSPFVVVGRIYSNGNANFEAVGLVIIRDSVTTNFYRVAVGANSGSPTVYGWNGGTPTFVGITSGQRDAAVWCRAIVRPISETQAIVTSQYTTSTSTTEPTSGWTTIETKAMTLPPGGVVRVGQEWLATNTAAHLAGGFYSFDIRFMDSDEPALLPLLFAGRQFDTTGAEQVVVASTYIGSGATIDTTALRAALARAENTGRTDIGAASVTWSVVRGASASPASSTYAASSSTSVSGSGAYLAVYAKITSSGTTRGSIDLSALAIPVTP